MINKLLTKIFGWKYFIAVYEAQIDENTIIRGNMEIKARRLSRIQFDWLRKAIREKNSFTKGNIMIINIIRVGEIKDFGSGDKYDH